MLDLYLHTENKLNTALRLDATVKYIEVVGKCGFQTNRLIFRLRPKTYNTKIVHAFNRSYIIVHACRTDFQILTASLAGVQQICTAFRTAITGLISGHSSVPNHELSETV